jgi:hypothetical protein
MDEAGISPGATRVALRMKEAKECYDVMLKIRGCNVLEEQFAMTFAMLSTKLDAIASLLGDIITELGRMKYVDNSMQGDLKL